jgi:hypothetical protein
MTIDVPPAIRERATDFAGREWVFTALDAWMRDPAKPRRFLLTGGPGTGKSTIAGRLALAALGEIELAGCPALGAGFLTYAHFCRAGEGSSLDPRAFVQTLAEALAYAYPAYRDAITRQGVQVVNVTGDVNVATMNGGVAIGVKVSLAITGSDARPLFDRLVRGPLTELCAAAPATTITILIDSIDEALSYHPTENIAQLLRLAADFPPQVRFVLTGRSTDPRVAEVVGASTLDLDHGHADDVARYAVTRLGAVAEPLRSTLSAKIAEKSNGNFLYARYVLDDLVAQLATTAPSEALVDNLPDGLDAVYRQYLTRDVSAADTRWRDVYRPLLGAIAVAQGDGFTRPQLLEITDLAESDFDRALHVCRQFLAGGTTDAEPFRIYHQSFREFLLGRHPYSVYPAECHSTIAAALLRQHGADWESCTDDYTLRYVPVHLAEAARLSANKAEEHILPLVALVTDRAYQERCVDRLRDVPMLYLHAQRAVAAAAGSKQPQLLPALVRAADALARVRRRFLRGEAVLELATSGDAEKAVARLPLFESLDRDWQTAAALIVGWLALAKNPAAAKAVHDRVRAEAPTTMVLQLLLDRFAAALAGAPVHAFEANPSESLDHGRQLVRRLTGQAFSQSLLGRSPDAHNQAEMIDRDEYVAELDGPQLVAIARDHDPEGTVILDEYIDAHAGYNYVEYRNRSLRMLLQGVLRHHPGQAWVLERLRRILGAALEGGAEEPMPIAPIVAEVLQSNTSAPVDGLRATVMTELDKLQKRRNANDSWSRLRRTLTGLVEVYGLVRGQAAERDAVWSTILQYEAESVLEGFAGFRAPAELRLADALRACGYDLATITARLDVAIRTSHHIQDYHFCARIAARARTLQRWHQQALSPAELSAAVDHLVAVPTAPEHAADHAVGEPYPFRNAGGMSVYPATSANTAVALAEVFQRPVVDLLRLNPSYTRSTPIPPGTLVRIPDPGLVPLLAAHLAARVVADLAEKAEKTRLLRSLAAVAAINGAALDAVLGYLLAVARPSTELLTEILTTMNAPA